MTDYYKHTIKSFIRLITSHDAVNVDYGLFNKDDRQILPRMKPFIQEALRLSISEGCEVHVFEQYDGSMCIMYDCRGMYCIEHEDPYFSGVYDVGTKFVSVDTNTPAPCSEPHESGGRFLDSLIDSMLRYAFHPLTNDKHFWNIIKLLHLVHELRDKFITLNMKMFDIAAEDHNEVCVRFSFDGEVLTIWYDSIDDIYTPYEFSFNINSHDFIAHTPHIGAEGVVFVKGNFAGEDEEDSDKDDDDDNDESEDDEDDE